MPTGNLPSSNLESAFSNVVSITIKERPEFPEPIGELTPSKVHSADYRRVKDLRRTTATLNHEQPGKMRIRTIREDGKTVSVLALHKTVIDAKPTEKIRIRAVLNSNQYGLPHSEWVTHDFLEQHIAQDVNQFRVRGVSKDLFRSPWVYSNVKNAENEEILFQLLHDFLDVTMSVYDNQIDIVTDFMLGDKFIALIKEHAPEMYNALELAEELRYRLTELSIMTTDYIPQTLEEEMLMHLLEACSLQASDFHHTLNEYFYASMEEYSLLMQSFKRQDTVNFVVNDHETLQQTLHHLEEIYENIVKRSNLEVFLENDSNSQLFLESFFKLEIQAETISHYFDLGFNDSVVSTIQSAVQLLVAQDVEDLIDGQIQDVPYTEFLGFVSDVLPVYKLLEDAFAQMLMHAEDAHSLEIHENPAQYVLFNDEGGLFTTELVYDFFEFIGRELVENFVDDDRFDTFSHIFSARPLVMIDRAVEELFKFQAEDEYHTLPTIGRIDRFMELYEVRIKQDFDLAMKKITTTPVDDFVVERVEESLIMSSILYYDHYDLDYLGYGNNSSGNNTGGESEDVGINSDDAMHSMADNHARRDFYPMGDVGGGDSSNPTTTDAYRGFKAFSGSTDPLARYREGKQVGLIQDIRRMTMIDFLKLVSTLDQLTEESKMAIMKDELSREETKRFNFKESKVIGRKDHVHRLVLFLLREGIPQTLPELMRFDYRIQLKDFYIIDAEEKVQYGLIDKEGDNPIGGFVVGTHTLTGEENFT